MTIALILVFAIGYVLIATEQALRVEKAAVALIMGTLSWVILTYCSENKEEVLSALGHHLSGISEILLFLLGAMAIVELIDAHQGFELIANRIETTKRIRLLWIISILAFGLSAILDNLTTTIVLISLVRKLVQGRENRLVFCGMIVIAANAGGAWSPIGDVTTTMLWIGHQIGTTGVMHALFIPSLVCVVLPLLLLSLRQEGMVERPSLDNGERTIRHRFQPIILFAGLGAFLFVPIFKTLTGLPPYLGMLLGLGLLWVITEILHGKKDHAERHKLSVAYALRQTDTTSLLFFFGILACIAALQTAGILQEFANLLRNNFSESNLALLFGLSSAIIDNVPLVAAIQGMYPLTVYPTDHAFWQLLTYCTGTGGSILIIGSAAGVAAMGMEQIEFGWYLRKFSWLALTGYLGGALAYLVF